MGTIAFASDAERKRLLDGEPGTRVVGTSGGKSYTVVKTQGEGYVAVNHMCPHLGRIKLSWKRSNCDGAFIQCAMHYWIWSLKTGEGVDQYGRTLPIEAQINVHEVRECDGEFSIAVD